MKYVTFYFVICLKIVTCFLFSPSHLQCSSLKICKNSFFIFSESTQKNKVTHYRRNNSRMILVVFHGRYLFNCYGLWLTFISTLGNTMSLILVIFVDNLSHSLCSLNAFITTFVLFVFRISLPLMIFHRCQIF